MSSGAAGYVLDAGVFIGVERRNRVGLLLEKARRSQTPLVTSAGVVSQVWRGGAAGQAPTAFLLRRTTVVDLTHDVAKVLGMMLRASRTRDPIDAHVAYLAREYDWPVLTSDPDDITAIDPTVSIEAL